MTSLSFLRLIVLPPPIPCDSGACGRGYQETVVSRFWDSVAAAVAGPQPRHFAQDVFIAGISNRVVNFVMTRDSLDGQEQSSAHQKGQS